MYSTCIIKTKTTNQQGHKHHIEILYGDVASDFSKQTLSPEGNDSMLGIRSHDGYPMMGDKTINVEGNDVIVALLRILGSRLLLYSIVITFSNVF